MKKPQTVLIVDAHALLREGMSFLLEQESDFRVVGTASTSAQAFHVLQARPVQLVIVDLALQGSQKEAIASKIVRLFPHLRVLCTLSKGQHPGVEALIRAGIQGYCWKGASREEFIEAVRSVANGRHYFGTVAASNLFQSLLQAPPVSGSFAHSLSPRETEILTLITREMTTREIAAALSISIKTVENHRLRLMQKTGARNLAGLTKFALKVGLLKPEEL